MTSRSRLVPLLLLTLALFLTPLLAVGASDVRAEPATPATAASVASRKALVRRYYELVDRGELDRLEEVLAPGFVNRTAQPGDDDGIAGLRKTLAEARAGLPDLTITPVDVIGQGETVVARTTIRGTHLGTFFGSPPTGRTITTTATDVWTVAAGELVQVWHVEDILGVMQQLGVVPDDGETGDWGADDAVADLTRDGDQTPPDAAEVARNERTARRFLTEVVAGRDPTIADDLLAAGFVWHWHAAAEPGAAGIAGYAASLRAAFPDLRLEPEAVVAEGDRVAVRWTMRGTQRGAFAGLPATGRPVATAGIDVYRFADGRIAELWSVRDDVALLAQLGAFDQIEGERSAAPGTPPVPATPAPREAMPTDPAAAEIVAAAERVVANLNAGRFEEVVSLTTPNFLRTAVGVSNPASAAEAVAFPPLAVASFANARIEEDGRGGVDVVYRREVGQHMLVHERWSFVARDGRWLLDGLEPLPVAIAGPRVDVGVRIADGAYRLERDEIGTGQAVVFAVANDEEVAHELAVFRPPPAMRRDDVVRGGGEGSEFVGAVVAEPGGTAELALVDLEPGRYLIACFLPSPSGAPHAASGMVAAFVVR